MSNQKIAGIMIPMATSKEVLRDFARYIKDAHPANAVHLTALVRYVQKKGKRIDDEDFDKEKVFDILFPDEVYKPSRMDRLYAKTVELSEDFLIRKGLDKRSHLRNMILAEALNDSQLDQHAKKKLEKNLDDLPDAEEERFEIKEKTHRQLFFLVEQNQKEKKKNRLHLDLGFIDFEIATTIGKLKYCCEIISRKLMFGEPISANIQAIIDRALTHIPYKDKIPLIDIQAESVIFLSDPTREKFQALKQKFLDYLDKLHSEKKEILLYLINGLAFIKHEDRLAEYFELNKIGVENGLFIENKKITSNNFNNIVYGGCENGEVDWTEQFIENNFKYLNKPKQSLENIRTLYGCFLNYAKGNYQAVLDDLDSIYFEDYTYGIHRYSLQLKSTYELSGHRENVKIMELIKAFKSFLNRSTDQKYMSEIRKRKYTNSLNILNRLVKYPYDDKSTKENLLAYYEAFNGKLVYVKWLGEKIRELKG